MLRFSSFCFLFCLILNIHSTPVARSDCELHVSNLAKCSAVISTSGSCVSVTANLTNTEYSQCTSSYFFWSYPLNNLTLIIQTPFTQQKQSYSIELNNQALAGAISHLYRIRDNQEIDITTTAETVTQTADDNGEVILKFQGPTRLSRYGVDIDYKASQTSF